MTDLLLKDDEPSEDQFSSDTFLATSTMRNPPPVTYLPVFDYSLTEEFDPPETKGSPFNYPLTPNKNKVFFNPFMSRSNKRGLNISSNSAGSSCSYYAPISKRLKFLKHDTSICSDNCDSSLEKSSCTLNNINMTQLMIEPELEEMGGNNNSEVCSSCTDLSPSVAECLDCPEKTSLCKLCLAAHKRVRLTRDHKIQMINPEEEETGEVTLLKTFQTMVDLVKMTRRVLCLDLDSAIDSCITEALNFQCEHPDFRLRKENDRVLQELLSVELLPLFHEKSREIHVKVMKVLQAVFELEMTVEDPAILVTDSCLEAYKVLLSSDSSGRSDSIILTLDCLSTIVGLLASNQMKYQVSIMRDKLNPVLSKLQDSEENYVISVRFKASKLSRLIIKAHLL